MKRWEKEKWWPGGGNHWNMALTSWQAGQILGGWFALATMGFVYGISVARLQILISNINIQMSPGDVIRFRWHHFRLMGTRLLREDPSRRIPPFVQIPFTLDKHDIFKKNYPNVPRGCSAVPTTQLSPHGDPSAPRRHLQTKTTICPTSILSR